MMRKYNTEYKLVKWASPEELVRLLQENHDAGFRTELSRIYHQEADSGWTIFSKSYESNPPLLETQMRVGDFYSILNSTEVIKLEMDHAQEGERGYTGPVIREIDRQLKEHYKRFILKEL
jgi:hypothetical protein